VSVSEEGIDDLDGFVGLAVVEVLGVEGGAAEFDGGGKDGGIPIRDLVAALQREGMTDEDGRRAVAGISKEQVHGFRDGFAGLAEAGLVRTGVDELLDDLQGEGKILVRQQRSRDFAFFLIFLCHGDGINEDVGIEEDHGSILPDG
jgi:hypothetical protein